MIIAIDGPAASGKGTLAKRLALHYGLPHLDTGLLYRAVGRQAIDRGLDLEDADATADIAERLDVPRCERPCSTCSAALLISAAAPCSMAATSAR
jgi:cytidylate kinase